MAKMGAPLKIKKERISELFKNEPDGDILVSGLFELKTNDFEKEKDLLDFIVTHIEEFTQTVLDDEVISFEVELPITKQRVASPRGRRVDLFIKGKKKTYIIELKRPTSQSENRTGIGQILDYGREFPVPEKELILITTFFDMNTARTIKYYNLPIRYVFFSKSQVFEYKGENND